MTKCKSLVVVLFGGLLAACAGEEFSEADGPGGSAGAAGAAGQSGSAGAAGAVAGKAGSAGKAQAGAAGQSGKAGSAGKSGSGAGQSGAGTGGDAGGPAGKGGDAGSSAGQGGDSGSSGSGGKAGAGQGGASGSGGAAGASAGSGGSSGGGQGGSSGAGQSGSGGKAGTGGSAGSPAGNGGSPAGSGGSASGSGGAGGAACSAKLDATCDPKAAESCDGLVCGCNGQYIKAEQEPWLVCGDFGCGPFFAKEGEIVVCYGLPPSDHGPENFPEYPNFGLTGGISTGSVPLTEAYQNPLPGCVQTDPKKDFILCRFKGTYAKGSGAVAHFAPHRFKSPGEGGPFACGPDCCPGEAAVYHGVAPVGVYKACVASGVAMSEEKDPLNANSEMIAYDLDKVP